MTQRSIEVVIGRLVTDEEFRATFVKDPQRVIEQLLERGIHLTPGEVTALMATDAGLWDRVADSVDPRLQKTDLNS